MLRRNILTFSAVTALALALLPSSIVAQQGALKQQLVGTWTLVLCDLTANGTKAPFCADPSGSLSLDPSGRYIQVIAARGRPKANTTGVANRADITPERYKEVAQGVVAQFGTWSVNDADKTLTRKAEGALFPDAEGVEAKFSVGLTGDELKLVATNNPAAGATVWRRAK
jgi:hypothetical protein